MIALFYIGGFGRKTIIFALERQKHRTELKSKIEEIKRLEREREKILAMFAHDIKNALVPAIGFIERILLGKTEKSRTGLNGRSMNCCRSSTS
jgi:signal transduction histidine kinase